MVRPFKNNADYYSHDNNMRNNRKILALRAKFQHEGYAVFCMFLELLTEQNNFKIEIDEMELTLLAGDFQTTKERLQDILNFCIEIRLINKENNTYFSQNHIERMNPLLYDRERKRLWRNEVKDGTNEVKDGTNPVIPRKVKESKVKESKVKESKVIVCRFAPPTYEEVKSYCSERTNNVDPQKFVDFYESKGWVVGKTKMKNWQACVRTWEKTTSKNEQEQDIKKEKKRKEYEEKFYLEHGYYPPK